MGLDGGAMKLQKIDGFNRIYPPKKQTITTSYPMYLIILLRFIAVAEKVNTP